MLRVIGLLGVLSLVSLCLLGRALGQELGHGALAGGRTIWGLALPHRAGEVQRLTLNGAPLWMRSATVEASLEQVLAESQRRCVERGLAVPALLRHLTGFSGVVAERSTRDAAVACFEGEGAFDLGDLAERLSVAVKTGELGALGRFRYLYARRETDGRSAVLSLWSDASWNVASLFPLEGDAPGVDDPELVRPPSARRVLSAEHPAAELPIVVYQVKKPLEEVVESYADELRGAGLTLEAQPPGSMQAPGERLWIVVGGRSPRLVTLIESGDVTWVASLPLP